MKQKTITLYSFDELSKGAQKKAHTHWINSNDYYFLEDCMNEWLHELLVENQITDVYGEYDKANQKDNRDKKAYVHYSLSNSQGDGCMFVGTFEWENHSITIKHPGHYYHSNSKDIIWNDQPQSERQENVFEGIYHKICDELENRGYDFIEHEDSLEYFVELCDLNDYTFNSDGIMEN